MKTIKVGSGCSPKLKAAELAMSHVNEKCGRQMVICVHSPSFGFEKKDDENLELVRMINESGANVVLVGVGAPKQEKWIMRWKDEMPGVKVWMALGATIEFEVGSVKRNKLTSRDNSVSFDFANTELRDKESIVLTI